MLADFAYYLNLHVFGVKCWLRSGVELVTIIRTVLYKHLLAMHDSGCFNQRDLEEIFGKVFATHKSEELITHFGEEEKYKKTLILMCEGLPGSRKKLVK